MKTIVVANSIRKLILLELKRSQVRSIDRTASRRTPEARRSALSRCVLAWGGNLRRPTSCTSTCLSAQVVSPRLNVNNKPRLRAGEPYFGRTTARRRYPRDWFSGKPVPTHLVSFRPQENAQQQTQAKQSQAQPATWRNRYSYHFAGFTARVQALVLDVPCSGHDYRTSGEHWRHLSIPSQQYL